jgi:hypothetical protein
MGKPDAPATPDYVGAAQATAAGNRVNQFTPYGSLTYSEAGKDSQGNPIYNQNVNLSPVGQQLLDAQNQTSLGLSGLQGQGLNAVRNMFGNMPSADQLTPNPINPGQTAQDAIMARMQPMLNRQQDRMNNQLANQGIQVGSDAYNSAQKDFGQQSNDAYSQAALQGIGVGQQARQQGMNEQGFYSQMPIDLLNAVRTGSQVNNPTFGATAAGPNYSQAAGQTGQSNMNTYNAQTGQYNSMLGGLMNLGGLAMLGSDLRIKQDIRKIGEDPRGFGYYEYRYIPEQREKWGDGLHLGVIAQEVEKIIPKAVVTGEDGFLMVNYGAL